MAVAATAVADTAEDGSTFPQSSFLFEEGHLPSKGATFWGWPPSKGGGPLRTKRPRPALRYPGRAGSVRRPSCRVAPLDRGPTRGSSPFEDRHLPSKIATFRGWRSSKKGGDFRTNRAETAVHHPSKMLTSLRRCSPPGGEHLRRMVSIFERLGRHLFLGPGATGSGSLSSRCHSPNPLVCGNSGPTTPTIASLPLPRRRGGRVGDSPICGRV
jgi:hypothetical protein